MAHEHVLVVDDDRLGRSKLLRLLQHEPGIASARACGGYAEAAAAARQQPPTLVYLCIDAALLLAGALLALEGRVPARLVLVTTYDPAAARLLQERAVRALLKPFDGERFRAALAHARATPSPLPLDATLRLLERLTRPRPVAALPRWDAPGAGWPGGPGGWMATRCAPARLHPPC